MNESFEANRHTLVNFKGEVEGKNYIFRFFMIFQVFETENQFFVRFNLTTIE